MIQLISNINILIVKICGLIGKKIRIFNKIRNYIIDKTISKYFPENVSKSMENEFCNKIWFFWGQGIDNGTALTKIALNRLKLLKCYDVIVLSMNNIREYVEIPNYIYDKFLDGKISYTHFSDILRINLLSKYGGIWIDSTVIISKKLNELINKSSLITIPQDNISYNISQGRWSSWFIGSKEKKYYFAYLKQFYDNYWKKEKKIICYFLLDHILNYLYENNNDFKNDVDNCIKVDFNVFRFQEIRDSSCTKQEYKDFIEKHYVSKMNNKFPISYNIGTYSYYLIKDIIE